MVPFEVGVNYHGCKQYCSCTTHICFAIHRVIALNCCAGGHIEEHGSESTADDVSDSVSGCSVVEASHNASDVFAPTSPFASRSHTLPRAAVSRTRDVTLVSDGVTAGRPQVMDLIADSSKKSSDKSRKSSVKLPWRKNSSDDSKVMCCNQQARIILLAWVLQLK